ncbi:MAG: recombinase family protein [Candidatus Saccharimonadales bacterium]
MRNEFGVKIGQSKVDQTLKNPFYYGEMRVKGVLYPHKYEPIVSIEMFERVKAIQEGYKIEPKRWGGLPYVYRGLLKCESCGCRITFEKKKQRLPKKVCVNSNALN